MTQPKKRKAQKQSQPEAKRTPAQRKAAKKEYQHQYYLANRGKALEYQRQYNREHKAAVKRNSYGITFAATGKQAVRPERQTHYHHSTLMSLSPEKLERAAARILSHDAEYVGAK